MWSFGCILSELYTGAPLFPGENESQLIGLMVELVGTPPTSLLSRSRRKKFFDEQGELKNVQDATGKIYRPATKILGSVVECANQDFIALIKRCIEW
jgi:serine/threonine protein kinase